MGRGHRQAALGAGEDGEIQMGAAQFVTGGQSRKGGQRLSIILVGLSQGPAGLGQTSQEPLGYPHTTAMVDRAVEYQCLCRQGVC